VLPPAMDLAERLRRTGIRTHVDSRPHLSPGFKFNDWELRGVPIRLELGPRDLAAGSVLMSTRLGEGKAAVSLDSAPARLERELTAFQRMLLRRATEFRDSHTRTVDTWEEFVEAVKTGWALAFHCGSPECEDDIKAETSATRAASLPKARQRRACAFGAICHPPTESGSSSAGPTSRRRRGGPRRRAGRNRGRCDAVDPHRALRPGRAPGA